MKMRTYCILIQYFLHIQKHLRRFSAQHHTDVSHIPSPRLNKRHRFWGLHSSKRPFLNEGNAKKKPRQLAVSSSSMPQPSNRTACPSRQKRNWPQLIFSRFNIPLSFIGQLYTTTLKFNSSSSSLNI